MKKIYYLFMWMTVAVAFISCKPLGKTYNALDGMPKATKTLTYTLQAADYGLLPSTDPAKNALAFTSVANANADIPIILNSKFFDYPDGSNGSIGYTNTAISIKLPDSLYANIFYTPTTADYFSITVKYTDFSTAQAIAFLTAKFPTAAPNQLVVLNYTYYESGVTPNSGVPNTIHSYLFLNGAWVKIYTISPAQYASANRGTLNRFIAADNANLPAIFNAFLKNDITIADTVRTGDVIYVSYNYYASNDYQRVMALTYNGTNWTTSPVTVNTLTFVKSNGAWIPDPTVYYTLTKNDTKLIAASAIGTAAQRTNLGQYGDFSGWADVDLQSAMILVLTTDFPNPKVNVNYKVTFLVYSGKDIPTVFTFQYNGTAWVYKP